MYRETGTASPPAIRPIWSVIRPFAMPLHVCRLLNGMDANERLERIRAQTFVRRRINRQRKVNRNSNPRSGFPLRDPTPDAPGRSDRSEARHPVSDPQEDWVNTVGTKSGRPKHATIAEQLADIQRHQTIFVSIPSYRDPECSNTLVEIFRKAKYPDRIRVGVFEQNYPNDKSCMAFRDSNRYRDRIDVLSVHAEEAQGPMYARAMIEQKLYVPSDYVLNIDSHMMFPKEWDVASIAQLNLCPSEKPLLSMYPAEYKRGVRNQLPAIGLPTYLTFTEFHPRLMFPQQKRKTFATMPSRPQRSLLWGGGFSFASSKVIEEVPYDEEGKFIFLGEEISMAARLFTNGWDVYCPMTMLAYHLWDRSYRPLFWEQIYRKNCKVSETERLKRKALEARAVERMQNVIWDARDPECASKFALGTTRTLADFIEFTGIDVLNLRYKQRAKQGITAEGSAEEWLSKVGKIGK